MATWVITGANRGIGLEVCRQVKARGDHVFAACRSSSPELDALGVKVVPGVEMTNDDGAKTIAKALAGEKIDVLFNNAGMLVPDALGVIDFATVAKQFEVNAIGPLRITQGLQAQLAKGAKIALVSSRVGSMADNKSGGMYGYRMSKAALNSASVSLARDLAAQGIAVIALHPGYVRTDMTGGNGNDEPSVAAKGLIARVDALTPATSGTFFHANGEALPW